jgi:hypothetical protein
MNNETCDAEALTYMIEVAPYDVAQTIAWMVNAGFNVTHQQGGTSVSFGDIVVEWERRSLRIKINRDRSPWFVDVAAPGLPYAPIDRLLTAKNDYPIVTTWEGPRPEQLPPGVTWTSVVSELIAWIEGGDRKDAIEDAVEEWGSAIRKHYGIDPQ